MDFTQPWDFGDATFIVEEKRIYASKAVLSMSSEVFKAMFASGFKEKEMTEIPLPDKKFDDFLQLMQIIHPQVNDSVNDTSAYRIVPLAHEYQIQHLLESCEKYLITEPSIQNLILADKLSLPKLRKVCIEYMMGATYNQLLKDPGFNLLDANTVLEVFHDKLEKSEGKATTEQASQEVIKRLRSEEPSLKNLQLAQKYNVPDVYNKCLEYAKNTPLGGHSKDYWENINLRLFENLKPSTYIEILKSKVVQFNDIRRRIGRISDGEEYNTSQVCTNEEASSAHSLGQASGTPPCPACLHYNMEKIQKIIKAEL